MDGEGEGAGRMMITNAVQDGFTRYQQTDDLSPLFILGDAQSVLHSLPDACIDFCMTSPPYWGKRQYDEAGIGLEATPGEYVNNLVAVFGQIKRVLKTTGSFWLNLGDTYHKWWNLHACER